ncbi:hypothetical protein C2S52_017174 [Perilla frutescens var. hirtella]|nr:hypothetical protein C2S52_017174 [Perilla frutescens var. hirtella]
MGEMASLWSYEEVQNQDMEQLGEKLMCTTLELEKLKADAVEEMKKDKEYIKQLIQLLKYAVQERDEARNQFQKLLNKTMPISGESFPSIPLFQSDCSPPLLKPAKANSSITESNSMSETYNLHSHGSSPVDSLFDAVSSPDFSNINLVVNNNTTHHFVQDSNAVPQNNHVTSCIVPKLDQASLLIDNLAKGALLPQSGKFLQAVLQAGPLLQTLLVAGPLPRWRNPPQFQAFQIPPFSIKGCQAEVFDHKPAVSNLGQLLQNSSQPLSCASAQVHSSAPMLSFANLAGTSLMSNASLISPAMNANAYAPLPKRQRFC